METQFSAFFFRESFVLKIQQKRHGCGSIMLKHVETPFLPNPRPIKKKETSSNHHQIQKLHIFFLQNLPIPTIPTPIAPSHVDPRPSPSTPRWASPAAHWRPSRWPPGRGARRGAKRGGRGHTWCRAAACPRLRGSWGLGGVGGVGGVGGLGGLGVGGLGVALGVEGLGKNICFSRV